MGTGMYLHLRLVREGLFTKVTYIYMHNFIDNTPIDPTGESMITALIDADSISYIVGYQHKDEIDNVELVAQTTDQFISQMLVQVQGRQYAGYFSPKICFRHKLYPEYKGKRKPPHEGIARWKPFIEEHCRQQWGFGDWPNYEADDAVSAMQYNMANSVICSPDKDLRQVPGNNFDYKKGIRSYITKEEAYYNLCYQLLVGDSTDNIPGCRGIGEKTAKQILSHTPAEGHKLESLVFATYKQVYGTEGCTIMADQLRLVMTMNGRERNGGVKHCRKFLHTFDLDAAGTSSYLTPSQREEDAAKLFGDW